MFTPEQIAQFSELDYAIYDYVVKHPHEVAYMRIRELAEAVHVSPPTVLRFCKKVGCDGFSEFKTKWKLHLRENERTSIISSQEALREFFERTLTADYERTILDAATVIARADHVIFVGSGSSGILAEYGSRYFSAFTLKTRFSRFTAIILPTVSSSPCRCPAKHSTRSLKCTVLRKKAARSSASQIENIVHSLTSPTTT